MRVDESSYEVKNESVKTILKAIGLRIAIGLQDLPGWGFSLLIFSFGEGGSMFYMSNSNREDMIKAMKEFIQKEEAKENERGRRES